MKFWISRKLPQTHTKNAPDSFLNLFHLNSQQNSKKILKFSIFRIFRIFGFFERIFENFQNFQLFQPIIDYMWTNFHEKIKLKKMSPNTSHQSYKTVFWLIAPQFPTKFEKNLEILDFFRFSVFWDFLGKFSRFSWMWWFFNKLLPVCKTNFREK